MKQIHLLLVIGFINLIVDKVNCECQYPCATCVTGSDTYCSSCQPYHYLSNHQCLECDTSCGECYGSANYCVSCPKITQYPSNGICYNCESPCVSCHQDSNLCESCINQFELKGQTCSQTTNVGNCAANCTSCSISNNSFACTGCYDGYYLNENKQCLQCEIGYKTCHLYSNLALSCESGYIQVGNSCIIDQTSPPGCYMSCKTCVQDEDIDSCTSCFENDVLIGQNGVGRCVPCESPCFGCQQDTNICTCCEEGYQLFNSQCFPCNINCLQCEDGSNDLCKQCKDGFYLHPNKYCIECDPDFNCLTCQNGTSCTTCMEGYNLDFITGKCVHNCDPSCATCSGATENCSSCNSGFYLFQGKCILCTVSSCEKCVDGLDNVCQLCNVGKYLDPYTNECKDCTSNCSSCRSNDVCDQCYPNYTVGPNGMCQLACYNPCKTCNYTPTYCTSCFKRGQIAIGGICQSCEEPCATCEQDTNFCTNCLDGYYLVPNLKKCLPCKSPCSSCQVTEQTCTKCITGYKLNKGNCELCQKGNCFDDSIEIPTSQSSIILFSLIILIQFLAI